MTLPTQQITFDGGKYEITIDTETKELTSANWLKVHPNGNSVAVTHANLVAIALQELQIRLKLAEKNEVLNIKNKTIAKLDKQVETLDKGIEELEQQLAAKQQTVDELYKANENLAAQRDDANKRIKALEKDIEIRNTAYRESVNGWSSRCDELQQTLNDRQGRQSDWSERKANFQQTINELLEDNNRLKRELHAKRNDKPDTQSYTIIVY